MPKRYTLSDRVSGQYKTSLQPQNDEDKEPMAYNNAFFGINPIENLENNLKSKLNLNVQPILEASGSQSSASSHAFSKDEEEAQELPMDLLSHNSSF